MELEVCDSHDGGGGGGAVEGGEEGYKAVVVEMGRWIGKGSSTSWVEDRLIKCDLKVHL